MKKNYQKNAVSATTPMLPEAVSIAMAELAGDVQEGLLAMAVGTGLQVMAALMNADVEAACGPKGKHDPGRSAVRHGTEAGSVTLGGRRVPVQRPRMRAADGRGELPVPAYELFSRTEVLGRMAMQRMLAGLSTRRYPAGLEPVGKRVEESAGRRASRRCRAGSSPRPRPRWASCWPRTLGELDLVALMIDGVHFGEHLCVVALGIGIDGVKHPLGLVEGSTENTSVVTDLLTGLRDRGLDTTRPIFVGIDGGKALASRGGEGVRPPGDRSLPVAQAAQRSRQAARTPGLDGDQADAGGLPRRVRDPGRGAARGPGQGAAADPPRRRRLVREGLAETLTVLRLGVSPTLARTLRSTNSIESMISIARNHSTNVKNWQNGTMALRWCAAGMIEARNQFRRVNGHLHLPALRVALDEHIAAQTVGTVRHDDNVIAA